MLKKRKFGIAFLLSIVMCFSYLINIGVFAQEVESIKNLSENDNIIYSALARDISPRIIHYIEDNGIDINNDSTVDIISEHQDGLRSTAFSSYMRITTVEENRIESSILATFNESEDGMIIAGNDAAQLLIQPRGGYWNDYDINGISVHATCVYDRYETANYTYVRPLGSYFSYTTTGSKPSNILIEDRTVGQLYSKNGSSYSYISDNYVHQISLSKSSPASNTVYSKDQALSSSRCILPFSSDGMALGIFVTINGTTYSREYSFSA